MELVVNLVRQNVMGYNFNIKKCLQKLYALLIFMNGMDGSLFNRSISRTKMNLSHFQNKLLKDPYKRTSK